MVAQSGVPIPSPCDRIVAPSVLFYHLAESLRKKGHEIFVYASKDSKRNDLKIIDSGINSTYHFQIFDPVLKTYRTTQHDLFNISSAFEEFNKGGYDLLHLDSFPISSYFLNFTKGPVTCTHHGIPSDEHDLKTDIDKLRQKKYFQRIKFVAISDQQRQAGKHYFNYARTIYHGINLDSFIFNPKPQDDLIFVGRIIELKGPEVAIRAALKTSRNIKLFGSFYNDDYQCNKILPFIDNKRVKYEGHIPFDKIGKVYGQAKALLMPIAWDEPFGMVVIEAMACGTPVIAYDRGSMSELIVDGITGFLVKPGDFNGLVKAINKIDQIDRKKCREYVKNNFSLDKMADNYEKFFLEVIKKSH